MIQKLNVGGVVLILSMLVIAFHAWLAFYCGPLMLEIYYANQTAPKDELAKAISTVWLQVHIFVPLVFGAILLLFFPAIVFYKNRQVHNTFVIIILGLATYLFSAYLVLSVVCLIFWLLQRNESRKLEV